MNTPAEIREILEKNQTFALFGHEYIDGDALWAILGLGRLLEKQWKTVSYFTPYEPSRVFSFLNWEKKVKTEFDYWKYDVLVFLDFNSYKRISAFTNGREEYFDPMQKVIIDHHKPELEPVNTAIYRDPEEISTCSLLYDLCSQWWPELIDSEVATYLYMGLSTDSGNFRYDEGEQSVRVFQIAANLLKLWAQKKVIIDEIFRNKTYRSVQFMQLLLSRMQKVKFQLPSKEKETLNLIYSFYEDTELEQYAVDHDEADYGLYIMQDIRNNDLVVLFKKIGIYLKASLRSRGGVDCSALARSFWWWGHHNAAGFKIQGSGYLEKDIADSIKQIQQHLEQVIH